MENNQAAEILCMQGEEKLYAVGFEYVTEICTEFQVSSIPCFPKHFPGVTNYKGEIIPVTWLEETSSEQEEAVENCILLVLRYQKYMLGIILEKSPYSILPEETEKISHTVSNDQETLWSEAEIVKYKSELISVIDVERSIRKMILFGEAE